MKWEKNCAASILVPIYLFSRLTLTQQIYGIQYAVADQSYTERSRHFYFIIGTTASMRAGWESLIRAGNKFAETKRIQDPAVSHFTTCITFSESISTPFQDVVMTEDFFSIHTLPTPYTSSERTNFSLAMKTVLGMLDKYTSRVPVVIIMISDGDDAFPHKELKRMCEDGTWKKIDSFWGVGFGAKSIQGTVMGMAQWMVKGYRVKSHFCNPKDLTELVDLFEAIAKDT